MKNLLNSKAIALEVWLNPLNLCLCPIKSRAPRVNTRTTIVPRVCEQPIYLTLVCDFNI